MSGPQYRAIEDDRAWLADKDKHRILLLDRSLKLRWVPGSGRRRRAADVFQKPEAVLARAPHVRVIDTCNDRMVLLRIDLADPGLRNTGPCVMLGPSKVSSYREAAWRG